MVSKGIHTAVMTTLRQNMASEELTEKNMEQAQTSIGGVGTIGPEQGGGGVGITRSLGQQGQLTCC